MLARRYGQFGVVLLCAVAWTWGASAGRARTQVPATARRQTPRSPTPRRPAATSRASSTAALTSKTRRPASCGRKIGVASGKLNFYDAAKYAEGAEAGRSDRLAHAGPQGAGRNLPRCGEAVHEHASTTRTPAAPGRANTTRIGPRSWTRGWTTMPTSISGTPKGAPTMVLPARTSSTCAACMTRSHRPAGRADRRSHGQASQRVDRPTRRREVRGPRQGDCGPQGDGHQDPLPAARGAQEGDRCGSPRSAGVDPPQAGRVTNCPWVRSFFKQRNEALKLRADVVLVVVLVLKGAALSVSTRTRTTTRTNNPKTIAPQRLRRINMSRRIVLAIGPMLLLTPSLAGPAARPCSGHPPPQEQGSLRSCDAASAGPSGDIHGA